MRRAFGSVRRRVVVAVLALVLLGAGGWTAVGRGSTRARATATRTTDSPEWRAHVEQAPPVVRPPTEARWTDGYEHYIVTLGSTTKPKATTKAGNANGPDGASGRWLRVSGPGEVANLGDARGRALLPWIRAFVTDSAGATWVRLADDAPASLALAGRGAAAPETSGPSTTALELAALRKLPHTTVTRIDGHRWTVRTKAARAQIDHLPGVTKVASDALVPVSGTVANVSNDPLSDEQWHLQNRGDRALVHPGDMTAGADADVPAAWAYTRGEGVTVAVIDTGMDVSNPDLAGALWTNPDEPCGSVTDLDGDGYVGDCHGWDFTDDNATGQLHPTMSAHGTAVSGIIAATGGNGIGISGVAPDAKIMPLDVSVGGIYLSESGIEAAIQYAIDHHADIINLSLGAVGAIPSGLQTELDAAQAAGILVVAAAGNWGLNLDTSDVYPAGASVTNTNVLTVGASNPDDTPNTDWSDYSPTAVQVFAPGNDLMTTTLASSTGGFALFSGTSAAAPVVAGEAALVRALNPALTPAQIIQTISSTSQQIAAFDGYDVTGGRVDVAAAVRSVADAASTVHYEFDGFNALTGSTQNTNLQISTDASAIPSGDDVSLSLTLATRISDQTMVVTGYPLSVTDPAGHNTTVTTDGTGTATLTGVDPSSLSGSAGTFALTTGLPDGLYALATQLHDDTTGHPVGSVGRVVFAVDGSLAPTPSTAPPTTTATDDVTTTFDPASTTTDAGATTTTDAATATTDRATTTTDTAAATTTVDPASTSSTDVATTTIPDASTSTSDAGAASTTTTADTSSSTDTTDTTDPSATSTTAADATTTTVPLPPPPDSPSGLTATPGNGSVTLTWTPPNGGVNGYRVYDADNLVAQTGAPSITFIGLENGQSHDYAVSAYTIYGESARTAIVSVTPTAPVTTAAPTTSTSAPPASASSTTTSSTTTSSTVAPAPTTVPASPYEVAPGSGPMEGGTAITITGPDLGDDVGIFIDDAPATDVQHVSTGVYTASTGPNVGPGTYDVQIIDHDGNVITIPGAFTYLSDSATTTVDTAPDTTPDSTAPDTSPPSTGAATTAPPTTGPITTAPGTTTPVTAPPSNGLTLSAAPPGGPLSDFPPGLWDGARCRSATC